MFGIITFILTFILTTVPGWLLLGGLLALALPIMER